MACIYKPFSKNVLFIYVFHSGCLFVAARLDFAFLALNLFLALLYKVEECLP